MYALNMLRIAGDSNYKEPLVLYSDQTENRYPYSSPVTVSDDGFQVFPNPAQNFVTIVLNKPLENTAVYELSDVRGEVLKSGVISSDCTEAYIDLKGIPVGIYFLSFKLKDSVINVIKLIVE